MIWEIIPQKVKTFDQKNKIIGHQVYCKSFNKIISFVKRNLKIIWQMESGKILGQIRQNKTFNKLDEKLESIYSKSFYG